MSGGPRVVAQDDEWTYGTHVLRQAARGAALVAAQLRADGVPPEWEYWGSSRLDWTTVLLRRRGGRPAHANHQSSA